MKRIENEREQSGVKDLLVDLKKQVKVCNLKGGKMIKFLQEYGWIIWLGGALQGFTGFGALNSWQWWAIIIPVVILNGPRR